MSFFFSKYQGAGNDFILLDDRARSFPCREVALIQRLCRRKTGIGADGLILLQNGSSGNFRMRIFNADGSEAEMCGNGIRCFVLHLKRLGFTQNEFLIETMHREIPCSIQGDTIAARLGNPSILHRSFAFEEGIEGVVVDTGVPHAVLFTEELDSCPVDVWGRRIRHDPLFSPRGVNVNFAKILTDGSIRIRTYERGVEAETLACGTGSAAVAFVAVQKGLVTSPVRVVTASSDCLEFTVSSSDIEMRGRADFVFEGRYDDVDRNS